MVLTIKDLTEEELELIKDEICSEASFRWVYFAVLCSFAYFLAGEVRWT
jgi:hypothetical protein